MTKQRKINSFYGIVICIGVAVMLLFGYLV